MGTSALCRAHIWHTVLWTPRQERGRRLSDNQSSKCAPPSEQNDCHSVLVFCDSRVASRKRNFLDRRTDRNLSFQVCWSMSNSKESDRKSPRFALDSGIGQVL